MDLLKGLVSGAGCAPDGIAAAQNPFVHVMHHLADTVPLGHVRAGAGGW